MQEESKRPKAALLARCSSEANVCNQVLLLKEFARARYSVAEDAVYADHIGGGSSFSERQALSRLMQQIEMEQRKYETVLVQDPSRIARTPELVAAFATWLAARGVTLTYLPQNATESEEAEPATRF